MVIQPTEKPRVLARHTSNVTRTTYTCDGCGAVLDNEKDLRKLDGTTRPTWQCRLCQTTVPSVLAERIRHQKQNAQD